jgi:hypothetical protein
MKKEKPKMPEGGIVVEVPVVLRLNLLLDFTRFQNGKMCMRFSDTTVSFQDSDTGKKIGELCGPVGGGLTASVHDTDFRFDTKQLFEIACQAQQQFVERYERGEWTA